MSDNMTCQFGKDVPHLKRPAKILERSPICLNCWLSQGRDRAAWAAIKITTYR